MSKVSSADWFKQVVQSSGSLEKAHDFITGGQLTETLKEVGQVHLESAIDHLHQARQNSSPRERVLLAAGAMQDAYFFFDASARRGPIRLLRQMVDWGNLKLARETAASCAASVALLQWTMSEAPVNRRQWLNRVREQFIQLESDFAASINPWKEFMPGGWRIMMDELWGHYYKLERNVLPADLITPLPAFFTPRNQLKQMGYERQLALPHSTSDDMRLWPRW